MSEGVGRFFVFLAGFVWGLLFTSPVEADWSDWEASCRIHEIIEKKQDEERLEDLENPSGSDIRKEALKGGEGLEFVLREAKLKHANLTVHVRDLSDCIDDFVRQIPITIELIISNYMWKWLVPLYIAILVLIVSAVFGIGNLPGIIKRKKNPSS